MHNNEIGIGGDNSMNEGGGNLGEGEFDEKGNHESFMEALNHFRRGINNEDTEEEKANYSRPESEGK